MRRDRLPVIYCYQLEEVILGAVAKQVRQVAAVEGNVLEKTQALMILMTALSLVAAALAVASLTTAALMVAGLATAGLLSGCSSKGAVPADGEFVSNSTQSANSDQSGDNVYWHNDSGEEAPMRPPAAPTLTAHTPHRSPTAQSTRIPLTSPSC